MKYENLSIRNPILRIFLMVVVLVLSFLLILPVTPSNKRRKSEVYSETTEDIPLYEKPTFNCEL